MSAETKRAITPGLDDNPRPVKRQRLDSEADFPGPKIEQEPELGIPFNPTPLTPLPVKDLLISLPGLLIYPPNHRLHAQSLCLSLLAVRKCLSLDNLTADIECRAWTALAEIGMNAIAGGFSENEDHLWARGIENEVEKATSKGLLIAQKHPSLRAYRPHLTLLTAQLSSWQHNTKFARTLLRRLLSTFLPSDPPHIVYNAHLAYINQLLTNPLPDKSKRTPRSHSQASSSSSSSPRPSTPSDIQAALAAIQDLRALANKAGHDGVVLLAEVTKLRLLVTAGLWQQVEGALRAAEEALGLKYRQEEGSPGPTKPNEDEKEEQDMAQNVQQRQQEEPEQQLKSFPDQFEASMALHVLVIGIVFHTYVGSAGDVSPRLTHMYALLDEGVYKQGEGCGVVEIPFPGSPPLYIEATHPRILYVLGYLVSSVAKRDPVGRKPKRKLFAMEGLVTWEKEIRRELKLPRHATLADVHDIELRMAKIKADLLSELVGVSITRSEFDAAELNLNLLISHTRTFNLFSSYAGRITLHHAHLAHALGQGERARTCYRVAEALAKEGRGYGADEVEVAARAGLVGLRIGGRGGDEGNGREREKEETKRIGMEVARACEGLGGTMRAVGKVIEGCLAKEMLTAKQHLKQALKLATDGKDNHLRALILALIASHFVHTAEGHAQKMLLTCEQLAAGLGASASKKGKDRGKKEKGEEGVGNAPLRLWIGERFLELYKRTGKEGSATKRRLANEELGRAVDAIAQRATMAGSAMATTKETAVDDR